MGDSTPPPWFTAFVDTFNSKTDDQNGKIDKVTEKLEAVQSSIDKAEAERKQEAEQNKQQISLLRHQLTLTDDLEVLILGLPVDFNQSYDNATRLLYTALGLSMNKIPLFDYREWSPAQNNNSNAPLTKGYVIELPTPRARTNLLAESPKLENPRANDIWKIGGPHIVSIRPLWPSQVYKIYAAARKVSKEIKFAQPIIKGLVVCMRKNRSSPATPIYSLEELEDFKQQNAPRLPPLSLRTQQDQPSEQSEQQQSHSQQDQTMHME